MEGAAIVDTNRTYADLAALLADNVTADISPADLRDAILSCFTLTTKGDIAGIDIAGLRQRLGVGVDGTVLIADAASTLGFKWDTPGAASHPDLATHDALGLATDAELAAHTGDTSDAHDASAVSILDTAAQYTATNVEDALAEVLDAEQAHEADSAGAHAASAISNTPAGTVAATTVQAAIDELATDYAAADSTHAGAADPHAGYRLESADHSHASTGLQGGQVAGSDLSGTPGGELGGTWASPTVDATHSGSAHHTRGHALLDGGTDHTDSTNSAVTRGDIIIGNSTPAWDDLAIGAAETILSSDGTDPSWRAHYITQILVFTPLDEDLDDVVLAPRPGVCVGESGEHGTFTAIRAKAIAGTAGSGTNTIIIEADDNPAFTSATTLFTLALNTATEVDDTSLDNTWNAGDIFLRARCTAVDAAPPSDVVVMVYVKQQVENY